MDHSYQPQPQHKLGDLRHSRSRDSGHTSYSQTRSEGLDLNTSAALNAQASSRQDSLPSSVPSLSTNANSEANSPSFLTCPAPTSPNSNLPQNWSFLESCENVDDPLVTVSQAQQRVPTSEPNRLIPLPLTDIFTSQDMSTLGIQFDPQFDASIRTSYPWSTGFDINEQFNQIDNNTMDPLNMTGNSNVPSFARSLSSTPPQTIFTPEQRELKRQRDLARRESKARIRKNRSTSTSCYNSQNTTPDMIPRTIINYSSATVASALKAEASPSFPSPNYMAPLAAHMPATECPEMFTTPFPSMIQNEYNINDYLAGFAAAEPSLASYPTVQSRPHSLSSASAPDSQYYRTVALASHPLTQDHLNSSGETVRVVHSRPKPQCWDHGCNGRQFSTFSNLLRHQREKSGVASKPTCPKCGAEFTRTTARNGHMQHEKCKQRRNT